MCVIYFSTCDPLEYEIDFVFFLEERRRNQWMGWILIFHSGRKTRWSYGWDQTVYESAVRWLSPIPHVQEWKHAQSVKTVYPSSYIGHRGPTAGRQNKKMYEITIIHTEKWAKVGDEKHQDIRKISEKDKPLSRSEMFPSKWDDNGDLSLVGMIK